MEDLIFSVKIPSFLKHDETCVLSSEAQSKRNGMKCLLCENLIFPNDCVQQHIDGVSLATIIRVASGHILKKKIELPQNCDPDEVQFCDKCLKTVLEIYEYHIIVNEIRERINSSVMKLEEVMLKGWLVHDGPTTEKMEWRRLVDATLEGYRNKMLLKKEINKSILLGKGRAVPVEPDFCTFDIVIRDNVLHQISEKNKAKMEGRDQIQSVKRSTYGHNVRNGESKGSTTTNASVSGYEEQFHPEIVSITSAAIKTQSRSVTNSRKQKKTTKTRGPFHKGVPEHKNPINDYQKPCKRYICYICERPVLGSHTKLMSHVFTHKNDDERRAAVAVREPGCTLALRSNCGKKKNLLMLD